MDAKLESAEAYVEAIENKHIDAALSQLTDGIVFHSPMGVKKGKDAVRQILRMVVNMPSKRPPPAQFEGSQAFTLVKSPRGHTKDGIRVF
ncbi:MAG: nuclear transport factor 2 family protein [Parvibaculaceae bacterium]